MYHVDAAFFSFYSDINAVAHLRHAAMDMSVNKSYQLSTKGNDTCLCAAKNVITTEQVCRLHQRKPGFFCNWLIESLEKIIGSTKKITGCLNREKLWTEYYCLQISTAFTEKWKNFLQTISAPTDPIFFQHCTRILFDNLLKDGFPVDEDTQRKDSDYSLTTEEDAIRHVH